MAKPLLDATCIFCRIIRGELPSVKVYEDALVVAILDAFPLVRGHILVIPKMHAVTLVDLLAPPHAVAGASPTVLGSRNGAEATGGAHGIGGAAVGTMSAVEAALVHGPSSTVAAAVEAVAECAGAVEAPAGGSSLVSNASTSSGSGGAPVLQEALPQPDGMAYMRAVAEALPRVAKGALMATGASDFNIFQNNGRNAGQEVPHVHFHVVPRFPADSLKKLFVARGTPMASMYSSPDAFGAKVRDAVAAAAGPAPPAIV